MNVIRPCTPPVYPFFYGEKLWLGLNEKTARKLLAPPKGHFLQYNDGEIQCLRCYSDQAFWEQFIFCTFVFLWDSEQLLWKPYYGWKKCFVPGMICPHCDKPIPLESHAIISFEMFLPEKFLLPGSIEKKAQEER